MTRSRIKHCMSHGCTGRVAARCLCNDCYSTARYLIRSGKTSWDQLEAFGLAGPKRNVNASPLMRAFARITARKADRKPADRIAKKEGKNRK